ncbi:GGDEF domain-containing protein [Vibrio paucivorans]
MKLEQKIAYAFIVATVIAIFSTLSSVHWFAKQISADLLWKYGRVVSAYDVDTVFSPIVKEVELVRELASHPNIISWAYHPYDPVYISVAQETLETYRWRFSSNNAFVALDTSRDYYFISTESIRTESMYRYTLDEANQGDKWFFAHKLSNREVSLGADHDDHLGLTKLWVNFSLMHDGEFLGVIGTGLALMPIVHQLYDEQFQGVETMFVDSDLKVQLHRESGTFNQLPERSLSDFFSQSDYQQVLDLMNQQREGKESSALVVSRGEGSFIVSIDYIKDLNWYEVSFIDIGLLLKDQLLYAVYAFASLAIITVFWALYLVVLNVYVRPVESLRARLQSIEVTQHHKNSVKDIESSISQLAKELHAYRNDIDSIIKERTAAISLLTTVDSQTGLYNRLGMEKEILHELARGKRESSQFSLLWVDVQILQIEQIDQAITFVSKAIKTAIREYDSVCRWADNEFLILVRTDNEQALHNLSERIRKESQCQAGDSIDCNIAIGGAVIDPHSTLGEAIAKADGALYLTKKSSSSAITIWSPTGIEQPSS